MNPIETAPGIEDAFGEFNQNSSSIRREKPLKWSEARRAVIRRDCVCRICASGNPLTVHHFWPRGLGGGNELENLITLCEKCHQAICSTCNRSNLARVPGWGHAEHWVKTGKIFISLRDLFEEPSCQEGGRISPSSAMVLSSQSGRKMGFPWEFCIEELKEPKTKVFEEPL